MKLLVLLVLLVLCGLCQPAPATAQPLPLERFRLQPIDEAFKDPSFKNFREQLLSVIGKRDVKALLKTLSPQIDHSFGPDHGNAKSFAKEWKLEGKNASASPLWEELRQVLAAGGSFQGDIFLAPYVFTLWPDRFDSFDYIAVVDKDVDVKLTASPSAHSVGTLSYEIVALSVSLPKVQDWRAVRLPDGKQGYVRSSQARSPMDYRAGFKKEKGEWKLAFFLSGD